MSRYPLGAALEDGDALDAGPLRQGLDGTPAESNVLHHVLTLGTPGGKPKPLIRHGERRATSWEHVAIANRQA